MKRKRFERLKIIASVTGCVLLSPFIVPCLLIEQAVADRRRKREANNFRCVRCGRVLGQAAIAKANEYCRDHARELRQRFPHSRFRLVRNVWAICTECGARYDYLGKQRMYALLPDAVSDVVRRDH